MIDLRTTGKISIFDCYDQNKTSPNDDRYPLEDRASIYNGDYVKFGTALVDNVEKFTDKLISGNKMTLIIEHNCGYVFTTNSTGSIKVDNIFQYLINPYVSYQEIEAASNVQFEFRSNIDPFYFQNTSLPEIKNIINGKLNTVITMNIIEFVGFFIRMLEDIGSINYANGKNKVRNITIKDIIASVTLLE